MLGLIPARGGSKGIPGKNIKTLGDKPLIAYTIEAALNSNMLDDVIVSTDSEEIAFIAKQFGAKVPFIRPKHLANDKARSIDAVIHCIEELEKQSKLYDAICLLQPTSPFRKVGDIDAAIGLFIEKGTDSLVSVIDVPHEYNPHWVFEEDKRGYLKISTGEKTIISRRQDLPSAFIRNGAIYLTQSEVLKNGSFYGNTTAYYRMQSTGHVNLDTMEDWNKAERIIQKYGQ